MPIWEGDAVGSVQIAEPSLFRCSIKGTSSRNFNYHLILIQRVTSLISEKRAASLIGGGPVRIDAQHKKVPILTF